MKSDPSVGGKKNTILVVDDHPLIRQGLIQLLNQQSDLRVCGEAEDREEAIRLVEASAPDLAIVDLTLGETSGIDLIREFKRRFPQVSVLVLSMHDESFYAERVLKAGAKGYIMKGGSLDDVIKAIRCVLKGQIYLSEKMSSELMSRLVGAKDPHDVSPLSNLSDREMIVFEMIGKGHGPSEIAKNLHLSVKTIETYRSHLKRKLNLPDANSLRQYAIQWVQSLT